MANDRYQLALDAIGYVPRLSGEVQKATDRYWTTMERDRLYVSEHGQDMPEVGDWRASAARKRVGCLIAGVREHAQEAIDPDRASLCTAKRGQVFARRKPCAGSTR